MTRARRRFGWLAAAALLAHGWLPVVLQTSLAHDPGDRPGHAHHMQQAPAAITAPPAPDRSDRGQGCPVLGDPICLCALFASCLIPTSGLASPLQARVRRHRLPRPRRAAARRVPLFEARAPPVSA